MLEYAPVLHIVRRGIYKNNIVWLQDFRAIPRKKILDIVRNFAKSCQHTIFWLFAYGAVLPMQVQLLGLKFGSISLTESQSSVVEVSHELHLYIYHIYLVSCIIWVFVSKYSKPACTLLRLSRDSALFSFCWQNQNYLCKLICILKHLTQNKIRNQMIFYRVQVSPGDDSQPDTY